MDQSIPLIPVRGKGLGMSPRTAFLYRHGAVLPAWPLNLRCSIIRAAHTGAALRAALPGRFFPAFGRALLLLCLLFCLANCTLCSKTAPEPQGPPVQGTNICRTALATVGTPYASGGTSPARGFDCSGLVTWAYGQNGIAMPRTARAQSEVGRSVGKKSLREGDLVVFKIRGGMHTGIYTGRGKFVHSPSRGKNVREDHLESKYWRDKFVAGRRHARIY